MKFLKLIFRNRLTFFGAFIIALSCFSFGTTTFTLKNFLIPINGEVHTSEVYLEDVYARGRLGSKIKSKRISLEFKLKEYPYRFVIYKNLGDFVGSKHNTQFGKLNTYLNKSRSIVVWIKKLEEQEEYPKVFQLDIDNRTEIRFEEVRSEYDFIILLTFVLGGLLFWIGTKVKHKP